MRRKILLVLAAVAAAGVVLLIWRLDIPHWKKLDLSKLDAVAGAAEVYDADGNRVGSLHGSENRRRVSIDAVPEEVLNAFIAAEDLRFYSHHGVDIRRIFGAMWNDLRTLSFSQGASTITQQLIKLTHLSAEKRLSRKAQEIVLALQLERVMSKREILEAYLNTVYFGHGAYGVEAAANVYFGKSVGELSIAEGALLAGIIKAPTNYAPHLHANRAVERRNAILDTMADQGFITRTQAQRARGETLKLAENPDESLAYGWYTDAVLTEAASALNLSVDDVLTGGFRIHTGLDASMQRAAEALFDDNGNFPADAADGTPAQASLIALDAATGEVRAVIGGRRRDVALGLNRATQSARQPGSAFKPVSTYAAAIDAYGFVPSSTVEDTPRTFEGGYSPRNAGGVCYGTVTLREALSRSLNIATVDLADLIGTKAVRAYAQRFGIELSPKDVNLSLALGALTDGVSPASLAAAYCALANGGAKVKPHFIRSITDADGALCYRFSQPAARAVDEATAYMLTDMLKTAATTGSAQALRRCGFPIAGKTGTVGEASGGTRDVWTVAYTPELATAVWMGFDEPGADRSLPSSEGGSGYPARLNASFFRAVSNRLSGRDFARPASVKTALVDTVALERQHVALLTTEQTLAEYTARELFRTESLPQRYSENWTAPRSVSDFRMLSGAGEAPTIAFTARDARAEYLLLRTSGGHTRQIAVLSGSPGEEVRYTDAEHDPGQPADYVLLPRNALLFAAGTLLTGRQTQTVHYAPGGWLNRIVGAGAAEATQAPTEVEPSDIQSLFE